jgi:hypothetical protein
VIQYCVPRIRGRRSTLSLKLIVPWIVKNGAIINIESDNEDIEIIENSVFTVDQNQANEKGLIVINPKIVGRSVGADGIITAKTTIDDKVFIAEAYVGVISKIEKKETKKKSREAKKGLFADIKFDPTLDPKIRHYFNKDTGEISISSKSPSVSKYLGLNGEGQNEIHCQVLIAELVTSSVCREMARIKGDKGNLQALGGDYATAVSLEIDKLIYKYAHEIHDMLVENAPKNI